MTKKNTMADSPALAFLKLAEEQAEQPHTLEGFEAKSRRLQLLIKPSTHSLLKARAEAENTSVNDLINTILEKELKGE